MSSLVNILYTKKICHYNIETIPFFKIYGSRYMFLLLYQYRLYNLNFATSVIGWTRIKYYSVSRPQFKPKFALFDWWNSKIYYTIKYTRQYTISKNKFIKTVGRTGQVDLSGIRRYFHIIQLSVIDELFIPIYSQELLL